MTKHELAVDIFAALHHVTVEKAEKCAEMEHGEYKDLLRLNKSSLENLHTKAASIIEKEGLR
jgi:hypothetical protein